MPAASGLRELKLVRNSRLRPSQPCTATVVSSTVKAMIAMLVISRQLVKNARLTNSRSRAERLRPLLVSCSRLSLEPIADIHSYSSRKRLRIRLPAMVRARVIRKRTAATA